MPRKKTQAERSAATRRAVMDATIDLLLTTGYSRLTTPEIARKAGVSRGALTHHFESKEDVVAASIRHQLQLAIERIRAFSGDLADAQGSPEELVDFLWQLMSDGLYYVTLEYLPELRHNSAFRDKILPTAREFHASLDEAWAIVAPRLGRTPAEASVMLNATMCLIRGMLGQTLVRDDKTYFREMLAFWKATILQAPKR